jgi:hypothetical protein
MSDRLTDISADEHKETKISQCITLAQEKLLNTERKIQNFPEFL